MHLWTLKNFKFIKEKRILPKIFKNYEEFFDICLGSKFHGLNLPVPCEYKFYTVERLTSYSLGHEDTIFVLLKLDINF